MPVAGSYPSPLVQAGAVLVLVVPVMLQWVVVLKMLFKVK